MKTKSILTMCLLSALLMNCSDDDSDDSPDVVDFLAPLVGVWDVTNVKATGSCSNAGDFCNSATECSVTLTINADGTYSLATNEGTDSGTAEATESTIQLCEQSNSDCDPNTYTLSGSTLTITDDSPGDEELTGCSQVFTATKR